MVLTGHDIRGSGTLGIPGSIFNPGKIHPNSRVGNPGYGDLGDAGNGERIMVRLIRTMLRVAENRVEDIFVRNPAVHRTGPDVPVALHDSRVKKGTAIGGKVPAEFLIQIIGKRDRAVVQ
jgi:hypothetical protein